MRALVELTFPSEKKNIEQVEDCIDKFKEDLSICHQLLGKIRLAAVEAVTNAIEHGNHLDQNKVVRFTAFQYNSTLRLSIQDQGNGFNPDEIPDPTSPELLLEPNGRGVFLMKRLADNIEFKDNGSCIEMDFKLS
ncbi:MAG: ATP-binding protein [Chitinophagales bacterium]|nr:ATP-binding protein [Chitinophagales bacterium]